MKYQSLFSGENKKKVINLSSAEFAQRVIKVALKTDCCKTINEVTQERSTNLK